MASTADAKVISALVNRAYRPSPQEQGWTHEADLVVGDRISVSQVRALLRPHSAVLTLFNAETLVSCVHVESSNGAAHIGMLAVHPAYQCQGLGKRMLSNAESYALAEFHAHSFQMRVLDCRPELLAFYARRGYERTGETDDFPIDAAVGQSRVNHLRFERLAKSAS